MKHMKHCLFLLLLSLSVCSNPVLAEDGHSALWNSGITLIPYPHSVVLEGDDFVFDELTFIRTDKEASEEDIFAADELRQQLRDRWGINSQITVKPERKEIVLTRKKAPVELGEQGYKIVSSPEGLVITARSSTGIFYGVQTLLQLIQRDDNKLIIKGMTITDRPDIDIRAVHYDTKHFQEKKEYVKSFIRTLASYKVNMLIWEWEDKFAYKSHPEIGAPGAFTVDEMKELTNYARRYHVQIVPLIQGLGHVSYILKHPENKHLREIESNNWGFCPLREGTYDLMSDLIKEAVEATPGSEYVHIGCDETYVLGKGIACGCRERYEQEGAYALRQVYINRTAEMVKKLKRLPIAWNGGYDPHEKVKPVKGLFAWGGEDPVRDKAALSMGYPLYIYDPNPGIEHLFLPYFYRENEKGPTQPHLEKSYEVLTEASRSGMFRGMISTSWNCSGVHNQIWMLRYITAAEYSWNGNGPDLNEFVDSYFINYYGPEGKDIRELFILLNHASYYYMSTFERKVWHWGEVGKTHLPDLPRDDMEFDPYWNTEYADLVRRSNEILPQMERVLAICKMNLDNGVKNAYDFELFEGLAKLFRHTANTCLALSALEKSIALAARNHFDDNIATYNELNNATKIIEDNLAERKLVFNEIKATWEKSQLPKGMSTPGKNYVHARDQQRNYANRRPDLSFMICDEEALGLEEYLRNLKDYIESYKTKYSLN
jgi:hexosaminidase